MMIRQHKIRWNWMLGLILSIIIFSSFQLSTMAATEDVLTYTISSGEVTITDCDENASGELIIPDTIEGCPVTSIGGRAFEDCSNLTSIEIPEGVTSIGNKAFASCSSLTSIEIPEGVTSIEDGTFESCYDLASVEFSENITSIGENAFYFCSSLTNIEIPGGVTSIGYRAFGSCSSLTSIVIPEGVTSIGYGAFISCSSLTSVELPGSITSIGSSVFSDCEGLISVELSEGIKSVGNSMFNECESLKSIKLPESLTSIGEYAFFNCNSLTSIEISSGLTSIGDYAFCHGYSLTRLDLPLSITSIGKAAFTYCRQLTIYTQSEYVKNYAIANNISYEIVPLGILVSDTSKRTYCVGEQFSEEDTHVYKVYQGGQESVDENLEFEGFDSSQAGTCNVKVMYGEFEASFSVTILEHAYDDISDKVCNRCKHQRMISKVEILEEPKRTEFCPDEIIDERDLSGLELKVYYDDGTIFETDDGYYIMSSSLPAGDTGKILIGYEDASVEYEVKVFEKHEYSGIYSKNCNRCDFIREVSSIEIYKDAEKKDYCINQSLDTTGLEFKVNYWDGTTEVVKNEYYVVNFDSSQAGTCNALIVFDFYDGYLPYEFTIHEKHDYSNDQDMTCGRCEHKREVTNIEIYNEAEQQDYCINQSLDTTGIELRICYDDGAFVVISDGYSVKGYDSSKAGKYEIELTYENKSVSYTVNVHENHAYSDHQDMICDRCEYERKVSRIAIEKQPKKKDYCINQSLDTTGLEIKVTYTDGTSRIISEGYKIEGFYSTNAGSCKVLIKYEGKTTSYEVTIHASHMYDNDEDMSCSYCEYTRILEKIEIEKEPEKTIYKQDEALDLSGMVLKAYYSDGTTGVVKEYETEEFSSAYSGNYEVVVFYGEHRATFSVQIKEYVAEKIVLNRHELKGQVGRNIQLTATCTPTLPSKETVQWSSSDETVATVDSNGNVILLSQGTVVITASVGGKEDHCEIVVSEDKLIYDGTGYKCLRYDGTYVISEWKMIDDQKYYFNASGYRADDWELIDGEWYYFNDDGLLEKSKWIGKYYVNENGIMVTNAWVDNEQYYVDKSGAYVSVSGWFKLNGEYYYLNAGKKKTGWIKDGNNWYYLNPQTGIMHANEWQGDTYYLKANGAMAIGWTQIGEDYYYFNNSGAKLTNCWISNYYLKANGIMAKNEWVDSGKYYVNASGAKVTTTGWFKLAGKYYYLKSGQKQTGWLQEGSNWYYLDTKTGSMLSDEWMKETYYFKSNGAMATGWLLMNEDYYYFNSSGVKQSNCWIGNYYLKANGVMATDEWVDANTYYVDSSGVKVTKSGWFKLEGEYYYLKSGVKQIGWQKIGTTWYYMDPETGRMFAEEWLDNQYYFKANGAMTTGWATIGEHEYYFASSGKKVTNQWIGDLWVDADGKHLVGYPKDINIGTCPTLYVGDSYDISRTLTPADADEKYIVWGSSNENVAIVENGKITAIGSGTATITATVNGVSDTCTVRVNEVSIRNVTLDTTSKELYVGDEFTLQCTIKPENANYKEIEWISSDENVVTVENGVVKAVGQGKTEVTVKVWTHNSGSWSARCKVTVKERPYNIGETWKIDGQWRFVITSVERHTCVDYKGNSEETVLVHYKYYNDGYENSPGLAFLSSDLRVYDENGELMSSHPCTHADEYKWIDVGTSCTVSATYVMPEENSKIRIDVSKRRSDNLQSVAATYYGVLSEVPYVTLNGVDNFKIIHPGDELQAEVDTNYPNSVNWISSDSSIASVDNNGKITAHKPGIVNIKATVADKSDLVWLTVTALDMVLETPLNTETSQVQLRVTNMTDSEVVIQGVNAGVTTSIDLYPLFNINGVNQGTAKIAPYGTETVVLTFDTKYADGRSFVLDDNTDINFNFDWNGDLYQMQLTTKGIYSETIIR